MLQRMKAIGSLTGFFPSNGLSNGNSDQQGQKPLKRAGEADPEHPIKRPRIESATPPEPASKNDLDIPGDVLREDVRPRVDYKESQSTISNSEGRNMDEYRKTAQRTKVNAKAGRQRHRRDSVKPVGTDSVLGSQSSVAQRHNPRLKQLKKHDLAHDPIEDDEEVTEVPNPRGPSQALPRTKPASSHLYTKSTFRVPDASESDEDPISQGPPAKQPEHLVQRHQGTSRGSTGSKLKRQNFSDDELQGPTSQPPSKRRVHGNGIAGHSNTDPPSRADIQKTHFAKASNGPGLGSDVKAGGWLIKTAICLPAFIYPAKNNMGEGFQGASDKPCSLMTDKDYSMGLIPVDSDGQEIFELKWLSPNLARTKKVQYNETCSVVVINQSTDSTAYFATGALLVLEFCSNTTAGTFIDWVRHSQTDDADIVVKADKSQLDKRRCHFLEVVKTNLEKHLPPSPDDTKDRVSGDAVRGAVTRPLYRPVATRGLSNSRKVGAMSVKNGMRANDDVKDDESLVRSDVVASDLPVERSPLQATGRALRSSKRAEKFSSPMSSPMSSPRIERWTKKNPDWHKNWRVDLTFEREIVGSEDISRLDDGEFLNDSIISFYLKYLHKRLSEEHEQMAKNVYIFNPFFYEKLRSKGREINYEDVKSWTRKVDLLSYDYIIVPVNEAFHWWVAIICNAKGLLNSPDHPPEQDKPLQEHREDHGTPAAKGAEAEVTDSTVLNHITSNVSQISIEESGAKETIASPVVSDARAEDEVVDLSGSPVDEKLTPVLKKPKGTKKRSVPLRKYDPKDPRIITLDSLGSKHSSSVGILKDYLKAEIKDKKGLEIETPSTFGMSAQDIPMQNNFTDCGVYLLGYIKEFMKDPAKFTGDILQREKRSWAIDATALRADIRELILGLQKDYQAQWLHDRLERSRAKTAAQASRDQVPAQAGEASSRPPTRSPDQPPLASASATNSRRQSPAKHESSPVRAVKRDVELARHQCRSSPAVARASFSVSPPTQPSCGEDKPPANNESMIVNVDESLGDLGVEQKPDADQVTAEVLDSIEKDADESTGPPSKPPLSPQIPSREGTRAFDTEPRFIPKLSSTPSSPEREMESSSARATAPTDDRLRSSPATQNRGASGTGKVATKARTHPASSERSPYWSRPRSASKGKRASANTSVRMKVISSDDERAKSEVIDLT